QVRVTHVVGGDGRGRRRADRRGSSRAGKGAQRRPAATDPGALPDLDGRTGPADQSARPTHAGADPNTMIADCGLRIADSSSSVQFAIRNSKSAMGVL